MRTALTEEFQCWLWKIVTGFMSGTIARTATRRRVVHCKVGGATPSTTTRPRAAGRARLATGTRYDCHPMQATLRLQHRATYGEYLAVEQASETATAPGC